MLSHRHLISTDGQTEKVNLEYPPKKKKKKKFDLITLVGYLKSAPNPLLF